MDNNVSKNTFSHKFFKLGFTKGNEPISLKYLLKQKLLQTIASYRQQINIEVDLKFIDQALEDKMILLQSNPEELPLQNQNYKFFSTLPVTSIGYSCPIAFIMSAYLALTVPTIAENLVNLLTNPDTLHYKSWFSLNLEIVSNGWINFYLKPQTIAALLKLQTQGNSNLSTTISTPYHLQKTPDNLFPIQYVHARCCCLLLLGARENLISLNDNFFSHPNWPVKQPRSISWLNPQQNLWFSEKIEYDLLSQLLLVNDSFFAAGSLFNWNQLGLNLSTTVAVFLANCQWLGRIRRETPQKAIARLGLIALAQYWLQRILLEKLRVAAPVAI